MRKACKALIITSLTATLLFTLLIIAVYFGAFGPLPGEEELKSYKGATASLVMSGEGEIIGRFFSENRTNVNYRQFPSSLVDALIATEDIRFYEHSGIDIRSLLRVAVKSVILNDRGSGGGSTISQQLAKNIYGRERHGWLTVPVNKIRESLLAYRMERTYNKEEILTLYLNTVSFGENVYGIEAASRRFYNKSVEHLTTDESSVLVGMLAANTFYNPRLHPERAKSRRNVVIRQMEKYNYIQSAEADSLCRLPMALNYVNIESVNPAGYFLVRVRREAEEILQSLQTDTGKSPNLDEDGLVIHTTLNLSLQDHAISSFHDHLPAMQERLREQYGSRAGERLLLQILQREMQRQNLTGRSGDTVFMRIFDWDGSYNKSVTVRDSLMQALTLLHAGLAAMDPSTGAIKMWIGGIDYHTQPYDQVLARRQLASAFKPVLYAAALEQGIGPCHYLDNDSVIVENYNNWTPVNYNREFGGQYSLAGALSLSMNVPTFNLFLDVGFNSVEQMWYDMGFTFPLSNTPALALGTAEANILETAAAYSAFANGGYRVMPYSIESIVAPGGEVIYKRDTSDNRTRILSERSAMLMNSMLQKAVDQGTGAAARSVYGVNLPLAGKTGTSQNHADAWFAAYNPSVVIVSRAGASSRAIHFNYGTHGSGTALALPLVALTMRAAQQGNDLGNQLAADFPELPRELERLLECPGYREKGIIDRLRDYFRRDVITFVEEDEDPRPGLRSFFRRRFGR